MKRYVTLGDGRKIGLGAYVKAWKACLALDPKTPIGKGVTGWGQTAGEALRDLRAGMDDRINRNVPGFGKGRKWAADHQRALANAAWRVNYPRLVLERCDINLLPAAAQGRLEPRLRGGF